MVSCSRRGVSSRIAAIVVIVIIIATIGGVALVLTAGPRGAQSTITATQSPIIQTAYSVTGQIKCATFNITGFSPISSSQSNATSSSSSSASTGSMSVKQGDGVCLILNVVNATISNLVVTAPASFLLSSLPPQYHPGQQGASVVYASGVTYNGPARFRFVFGANQTGSYSLTATWNNVTVAEVTVSVQ